MRTVDRYLSRQVIPVWVWCIVVFIFVGCLIDLFEHLDEIIRYQIPVQTVVEYYASFMPLVFVQASPLALLLSCAFIATRLVRYQELLAMNAGGISMARASIPFLFVGWLISMLVFAVNEQVVPRTTAVYERLQLEAFRGPQRDQLIENVATIDSFNRLYHARLLDLKRVELSDLTVLEHDEENRPKRTIYARRALFTPHGWLLLYGTVTRVGAKGMLTGELEPFVERLFAFPITPKAFHQPGGHPETLRIRQLHRLITQLRSIGITNVRRYVVELASKVTFPLMNVVVCLIGFVGSTRRYVRGHLQGLGTSLGWGVVYYIAVAIGQGIGKEGVLPVSIAVWTPHLAAVALCWRQLIRQG